MPEELNLDELAKKVLGESDESAQPEEEQKEEQAQEQQEEQTTDQATEQDGDEIMVEIDGRQVPLEELKKGYMRAQDYTRKLNELSAKEKEVEHLYEIKDRITPEVLQNLNRAVEQDPSLTRKEKEEMQAYLEGIDPDDPVAKPLAQVMKELQEIKQAMSQTQQVVQAKQQEEVAQYFANLVNTGLQKSREGKEFVSEVEEEIYNALVLSALEATDPNMPFASEDDVYKYITAIGDSIWEKLTQLRGTAAVQKKQTVPTSSGGNINKSVAPTLDEVIKEKGVDEATKALVSQIFKERQGYKEV